MAHIKISVREGNKLRVLNEMFGNREMTDGWKKLRGEELRQLCLSCN